MKRRLLTAAFATPIWSTAVNQETRLFNAELSSVARRLYDETRSNLTASGRDLRQEYGKDTPSAVNNEMFELQMNSLREHGRHHEALENLDAFQQLLCRQTVGLVIRIVRDHVTMKPI